MSARDPLTAEGAERLARRIQRFWVARGMDAQVWLERAGESDELCKVYQVRSDMRNGMPRVKAGRVHA